MCMNRLPSGSDRNTTPCGARRGPESVWTSVVSTPSRLMRKSPMLGAGASMRPSSSAASASTVPSRSRSRAARYGGVKRSGDTTGSPKSPMRLRSPMLTSSATAASCPAPSWARARTGPPRCRPARRRSRTRSTSSATRSSGTTVSALFIQNTTPCRARVLGLVDRLLDEVGQDRIERTADLGHRDLGRPAWGADPGCRRRRSGQNGQAPSAGDQQARQPDGGTRRPGPTT